MSMNGWVQNVDFASTDTGEMSLDQAESLIRGHDWESERRQFESMLERGEDVCPAGIGFNATERSVFHIYTGESTAWEIFVRMPARKKLLGFIPIGAWEYRVATDDMDEAVELLRLYCHDQAELEQRLQRMERL